ncbi:MAG: HAD family hydrolase [Selenomonadaceae bacterium]|nr:HAD family hydrolase [Selenomonadaceae bacterium]
MVKLVAVDVDGTFMRDDYTFDVARFEKILARMKKSGCNFVVASGNQYYQLRGIFAKYGDEISFISDNGAYVEARGELIFAADIPKAAVNFAVDVCREIPGVGNFMCGVKSAYCERGTVPEDIFNFMRKYMPRMELVDDFKAVDDQILKFALLVPETETYRYYEILREKLGDTLTATTSGHGSIDLIIPGLHKASGIKRLVERFGIAPEECAAFGDSGNDIEMLRYCGESYAMANAAENVRAAAKYICPANNEDGVLVTLDKIFGGD